MSVHPSLGLNVDYCKIGESLDTDDLSDLVNYQADYDSNVSTFINESSLEDKQLLQQLKNPHYMRSIIEQFHQYFSNTKFTYLEQSTKEKFLRQVVNSRFISLSELEALKEATVKNKQSLGNKKKRREVVLDAIVKQLKENSDLFEGIKELRNSAKSTITRSQSLLAELDELEKQTQQYLAEEKQGKPLGEDEIVEDFLNSRDDFEQVIQEAKEDSLMIGEISNVNEFEEYIILNSSKNTASLSQKRKLVVAALDDEKAKVCKKLKSKEATLAECTQQVEMYTEVNDNCKKKIKEKRTLNEKIIREGIENGEKEKFKELEQLSNWLLEVETLLTSLKQVQKHDDQRICEKYQFEIGKQKFHIQIDGSLHIFQGDNEIMELQDIDLGSLFTRVCEAIKQCCKL